ncbi:MAG: cache domain-containing protein, partial [Chloroflexota bacterium]|nr:cache domain-containing protein [Chloroflexota bacterium]
MGRRWSLRARFVLVAAACLLPLLGAVLYVLYHSAGHGRDRLLDAQETTAGVVAQVLGATLEDNRSVLQALAAQSEVQRLEPERAESVLGQFRLARPNNPPGFFLVKSDRQIVATAGLGTPLPEGIGPVLDQALGPNGLGVSNRLETAGGEDVVAIAVPVLSKDQAEGQPVGVVGAVLSVDQLGSAVLPFARGETAIAIVGGGQVIATRANDDVVDRQALSDRLSEPIVAAAGALDPVTYADASGDEYLAAYAPVDVPGAEWAAFVTRPAPAAFAPTRM